MESRQLGALMLDRLFRRLRAPPEPAPRPRLTAHEGARLEHRRRGLERSLRRIEKRIEQYHCSSCMKTEDPAGVALDRQARAIRREIAGIEARLGGAS